MKEFKGRPLTGGAYKGEAVVSHVGFNTLASLQKSAMKGQPIICSDQNNPDLFGKPMTGKVFCLPVTIGSTTGGMILQTICQMGINFGAMLFSKEADSLALAGLILAKNWEENYIIGVDKLGDEFLNYVKDGMTIEVTEDGTVKVYE